MLTGHSCSPDLASPSSHTSSGTTGSPGPSILCSEPGYEHEQNMAAQREIERLCNELEDSRQQIDRDTEVINDLHQKVTSLEEIVERQKVTISTQSKTISDPRIIRKQQPQPQQPSAMAMFPMTPNHHHHHHHLHQYPGSGSGNCPGLSSGCGGNVCMMRQQPLSPFEVQSPHSGKSLTSASQCSTVFDLPPPKFEIPFGASYPAYTPVISPAFGRARDVFSPMAIVPVAANGGDLTTPPSGNPSNAASFHKEKADFSTRFQGLMRMTESFGQTHASFPNIFMDSHLEDRVKDYLMAISNREQASVLVGNAATRGYIVAKAINYYLVDKILKITAIKGFDASVDLEIGQIQKQMTPETPISVRHLMLTAMTTHLITLSKKPGFAEFSLQKIQSHLTTLWQYIAPLSHYDPTTQNSQMWTDLSSIISDTQALAIDMCSVPLEYKIEFPEPGEHFDPLTMINRDPYVHGDPQLLKNSDTRVRLGITPVVRIRNNTVSPGEIHLMYLGHVLLKVPKKQIV